MSVIYRALRRLGHAKEGGGEGAPPTAPPPAEDKGAEQPHRNRWLWGGVAAAGIIAIAVAAYLLWPGTKPEAGNQRAEAPERPKLGQAARIRTTSTSPPAPLPVAAPRTRVARPPLPGVSGGRGYATTALPSLNSLARSETAVPVPAPDATPPASEDSASPSSALPEDLSPTVMAPPPEAEPSVETTPPAPGQGQEQGQGQIQVAMEEPIQVQRSSEKLLQAMARNDLKGIDAALKRLTELKGANHHYVLKMRAFRALSQGDDATAEKLLLKVIEQRPDDLDAGLNLTLVELRTGKRGAARERTAALFDLYPDEPRLRELMDYLR